jgi:hypothetical protein
MNSDRALGRFQEINSSTAILNVTSLKHEAGLDIDFMLMASQSVFDTLGQEKVKDMTWEIINEEWN